MTWTPATIHVLLPTDGAPALRPTQGHTSPDAPGLAIVHDEVAHLWSVTHTASGYAIAWAVLLYQAQEAAQALVETGLDWTRPAAELSVDPAVVQAVAALEARPGVSIDPPELAGPTEAA